MNMNDQIIESITNRPRKMTRTGAKPMSPQAMQERQLAINKATIIPQYQLNTQFPPRPPGQFGSAPVKSRKNRK